MENNAKIIGYVDKLGYLRCMPCSILLEADPGYPIWEDSAPHNAEECDNCHVAIACLPHFRLTQE